MSKISASNMHDGRWMFTRTTGPKYPEGGTPCEIIAVRYYEPYDAAVTVAWANERAAGYPSLKRFEGGANWPVFGVHEWKSNYSDQAGATWKRRTAHADLKFGGEINRC